MTQMTAGHSVEDNSHAGQGPVLLDIGGDVGALIVSMPQLLAGEEIEIRPLSPSRSAQRHDHAGHDHAGHDHAGHDHAGHDHAGHDHAGHDHAAHLEHVGVVGRPVDGRVVYSAVFGAVAAGEYELYVRPDGPVQLTVTVNGGEVAFADWPQ
jgi:hypothetical protein